jgi:DNA-binding transcriptional LysR family regulator
MALDLNLLRVFDALMQDRKVVAASHRLGLSAPAVSNALARLRRATGDTLFVRTAQGMQPTPHALAMAQTLGPALAAIEHSLARPAEFEPATSARTFRVAMTDIGEIVFLPTLMQALQHRAPRVALATLRNTVADTAAEMARGGIDLAVGWLPDLDAGFHQRRLFEQRYVCLMAASHPLARGRLTLERFRQARHAVVAAEGTGHERIDRLMRQQGLRRVAPLQLPHFVSVPWIAAETDLVVTAPQKLADRVARPLGLVVRALPLELPPFEVNLFWHQRVQADPGHRWLRGLWVELFGAAQGRSAATATPERRP